MRISSDRCAWTTSPESGKHYSTCGATLVESPSPSSVPKGPPQAMELCPHCGMLVEHAGWDEVLAELQHVIDGEEELRRCSDGGSHEWLAVPRSDNWYHCERCDALAPLPAMDVAVDHTHAWLYITPPGLSSSPERRCASCESRQRLSPLSLERALELQGA